MGLGSTSELLQYVLANQFITGLPLTLARLPHYYRATHALKPSHLVIHKVYGALLVII